MLSHTTSATYQIFLKKKNFFLEEKWQSSKMIQWVKAHTANSANPSLMPTTHVVGKY